MIWLLLLIALVAVASAYVLGKRDGVIEANRIAVAPGAWVEVVKPLRCSDGVIPVGTQAIVAGCDRWGRLSLWIAEPWAAASRLSPEVHRVENLAALRTRPMSAVPNDVLEPTVQALAKFEATMQELNESLFPPGFLEIQRLLNPPVR